MMKYKCLVFDHDDTVVRSAQTVNYPHFRQFLRQLRPNQDLSFRDYMLLSADPGYHEMCRSVFGFNEAEMDAMFLDWKSYVKSHIPEPFAGIGQIIRRQKAEGGIVCVSSHSSVETIRRDWQRNFAILPDQIYSWELGDGRRKPAPFALEDIMRRYALQPAELVMIDDLRPGYQMARACGVDFIAAGWSHPYEELRRIMQEHCDYYLKTVAQLEKFLFA